jgi:hypothetical protein
MGKLLTLPHLLEMQMLRNISFDELQWLSQIVWLAAGISWIPILKDDKNHCFT